MSQLIRGWAVALGMALVSGTCFAQAPGFYYIGSMGGSGQEVVNAHGVGPGGMVVGTSDFLNAPTSRRAWRWTPAGGMVQLEGTPLTGTSSGAYGISGDGSVIVGVLGINPGSGGTNPQVFRRVGNGPNEVLPLAPGMTYPQVHAISEDGTTTVGVVGGFGGGGGAVRWVGTNVAELLPLIPGDTNCQAADVSADGSVIVGWSGIGYPYANVPVRWVDGQPESLGLPPGCNWAWASGVSADGNTVVGYGWLPGGFTLAFRWTPQEGMTVLDNGGSLFVVASSISSDGRTIGGRVQNTPTVWRDGVRYSVTGQLMPAGTNIAPFTSLIGVASISRDGTFVISNDRVLLPGEDDVDYHAWGVKLPSWDPCIGATIDVQPQTVEVCVDSSVTLSVAASGTGTVSYQWSIDPGTNVWTPLSDGTLQDSTGAVVANITGTGGSELGFLGVKPGVTDYAFRCTVSNECGTVDSEAVAILTGPCCPADLDDGSGTGTKDGGVDISDLLYFLAQFEQGSTAADLDDGSNAGTPDGGVDINDLLFFLVRFEAGC